MVMNSQTRFRIRDAAESITEAYKTFEPLALAASGMPALMESLRREKAEQNRLQMPAQAWDSMAQPS
jgi:hypothetical protein